MQLDLFSAAAPVTSQVTIDGVVYVRHAGERFYRRPDGGHYSAQKIAALKRAAAAAPTARRIDRTTDHMCDSLAADIAYLRVHQDRSHFRCVNCEADIPVHYVQFSMLCRDCRFECTDDSDLETTACEYCGVAL
jgi:hypothetical protein